MRLHLVVNPEGGLKKGISILKEVKPLFKKASIELNILKTEYSGHAEVYANTIEYLGYDVTDRYEIKLGKITEVNYGRKDN